ncbi:Hypothetical_protein [Hexamita inflata]|uniref:Hypothetical_protein n=1 Tax=Hexamita inflata TaxID=28002 RepID=A0AA86NJP2_9EUKA|nr:Hypothetical protein HINF_LOCUS7851 [Hexamita inflata]
MSMTSLLFDALFYSVWYRFEKCIYIFLFYLSPGKLYRSDEIIPLLIYFHREFQRQVDQSHLRRLVERLLTSTFGFILVSSFIFVHVPNSLNTFYMKTVDFSNPLETGFVWFHIVKCIDDYNTYMVRYIRVFSIGFHFPHKKWKNILTKYH